MSDIKDNVKSLVEHAEKFSDPAGPASSAFQRMHMEEIKKLEREIRSSDRPDEYLSALRRHLTHSNRAVRERIAYIIGELMLLHQTSREVDQCVNKLIGCTHDSLYFNPVNTSGREMVNALGKSGRPEAEATLLQLLSDSANQSIRQNTLVALGKTGGNNTVKALSDHIERPNLSIPDKIHSLWALGKLGSVQNTTRSEFPLARCTFERALGRILQIIEGNVTHPSMHYCAIYAVGEICDQREIASLRDSLLVSTLQRSDVAVASIKSREAEILRSIQNYPKFRSRASIHTQSILSLSEKVALRMIRGLKLDAEGERILFSVRILFDVAVSSGTDLTDTGPSDYSAENAEIHPLEPTITHPSIPLEREKAVPVSTSTTEQPTPMLPSPIRTSPRIQEVVHPTPNDQARLSDNGTFDLHLGLEEIKEEIEHQNSLRKELVKRLRNLEIEQARKGIDTPPQTITQIDDIRRNIRETETKILSLSQQLSRQ